MIIVGAGMAGLIAARYFERKFTTTVWEIQSELPHNHAALLRFRTDAIAKVTGIPFHKVLVHKAIVHDNNFIDRPNLYICNQYSLKVAGKILSRSIWNMDSDHRYIAPPNFISKMADGLHIAYERNFNPGDTDDAVISTIPMPIMMKKIGWEPRPFFQKRNIWALTFDLGNTDVEVYQTIYFSSLSQPYYRASIVGDKLIAEFISEPEVDSESLPELLDEIIDFFGIPPGVCTYHNVNIKKQEYGKIVPISDDERKEFIYTLTRDYNIYSLGRFATWRQILLDDLVHDLEIIESLIGAEGKRKLYAQRIRSAQIESKASIKARH